MTTDPIARLLDLRVNAPNPLAAAIAQLTHALLVQNVEMRAALAGEDEYDASIAEARIEGAFAAMERIPDGVWNTWSEVPKAELISRFRKLLKER